MASLKETLTHDIHTAEKKIEYVLREKLHIRIHKKVTHHVQQLRKRPDHHKQIIAFSVAFICTCFVFIAWYYISFPKIVSAYKVQKKENAAINQFSNPLDGIKNRFETAIEIQ